MRRLHKNIPAILFVFMLTLSMALFLCNPAVAANSLSVTATNTDAGDGSQNLTGILTSQEAPPPVEGAAPPVVEKKNEGEKGKVEGSPAPSSEKAEKEKYNPLRNLETWQVILLALTPIIIIVLFILFNFIRSRIGDGDDGDGIVGPEKKGKKDKEKAPKSKHDRRLQLALDLLDHNKIAREGMLKTDFYLRSVVGSNKGEIFPIKKYVCKIGRHSTDGRINDIQFSSYEKKISRAQCLLVFKPDEDIFYIVNESDVPIFVNNDRVKEAYPLREGDHIRFAKDGPEVVLAREVVDLESE